MKKNNLILIGFMGVGKGTVARALVSKYDMFAIDTDDIIESQEKKKIKDIFKEKGETYFRSLEQKCADWLENSVDNTVISTGGGFYKRHNLQKVGKIIYLQSSFEGILNRIGNSPNAIKKLKKRPLLQDIEEAKKLYNLRIPEYENISDIIVNVEDRDIDDIVKDIMTKCKA
ncbi:MAG: shikimate kinase [Campylobacteraceae bacterium]|nr:shikimate kinase [Campylobacteraceae bacterium]